MKVKVSGSISVPVVLMGAGVGEGLVTGPGDGLEDGACCCWTGSLGCGGATGTKTNINF